MKYFSCFSGIGGFELGIQYAYEQNNSGGECKCDRTSLRECTQHGATCTNCELNELQTPHTCVGFSEIDKYATQVYKSHFPNHTEYGDITKIDTDTLPDFDCLVGGFPCQAFSIAGKRKGFEDTRGTLFFELARILRAKKPRLFVFENVKGLLSHDNGKTFSTIIATIDELGYDCQWQVLNSKNHGVPQNRERVYIIGHLRGTSRPKVFPIGGDNEKASIGINRIAHMQGYRRYNQVFGTDGATESIDTAGGGGHQPCIYDDYNSKWRKDDLTCTLTINSGSKSERNGQKLYDGMKIRRLTPTECERLQGFPDGWTSIVSDSQRYKCCGNAVTTNVVRDIFNQLICTQPNKK